MLKGRQAFLEEEEKNLAPYAVKSNASAERVYEEEDHPYRLPFQRDKDRILHSQSFKRLEYKTQVFVYSVGDHYRNRLTHTLEVAGVSRTIAKVLGLNEDLSEAISLAHDLGHSPFGHAGQEALADIMRGRGGFEHNKQSLRVVQKLERKYPNFPGLNLCYATLAGIMKHGGDYDLSDLNIQRREDGPSLEAQIVDYADEIAYSTHDIEDGVEKQFLKLEDLMEVEIWRRNYLESKIKYPTAKDELVLRATYRNILNEFVSNLITTTSANLSGLGISSIEDVYKSFRNKKRIVGFADTLTEELKELKHFLWNQLYRHPDVMRMSENGKETIHLLFQYFEKNPSKIPDSYLEREKEEGRDRIICDYIAGMTDRYAVETLKSEGIFWQPY
ncbi:deoxyguanosinetriphosphate triphosphohydrolase [Leptospira ilyithenensis]|uniref:Deoxyguanosinetriphosphate triphosphohydrolase-like protein n=1 Tax=Leptospira ilyithenensis TaxID=2484901 RepID=A0A4R9LU09_9LEPT|nr:deoxyguanosinetriphosphate triphosphohydrolase [Leptospira ilyithenensis]TGN13401.1 deoxyguanosinetriphosphate triphosphohydrolase [Leptospira ilyithenensis]